MSVQEEIRPCPICSRGMKKVIISGETIDQCQCGFFFDQNELENIVSLFSYAEDVQLDEEDISKESLPHSDAERKLLCPKDQSIMNAEFFTSMIIDRCPTCDGIWLDRGEFVALKLVQQSIQDNLTLYIRLGQ